MSTHPVDPCALVIGLCSHGLAISRSLRRQGIEVHAFEANPRIPGALTNSAQVHIVDSIKDHSLIDDLLAFRARIPRHRQIVLFPTNDSNVRIIATHLERLRREFVLSWADCAATVQWLLLKSNIGSRCEAVGLNYPRSAILAEESDLQSATVALRPPFIIKPANPQSGFKALKCESLAELRSVLESYPDDYPFVVQEWVEGTDKDLYFCAFYLNSGRPIVSFVGNKLESYPPALGQTTVAVSVDDSEVVARSRDFFDGLELSGPVSLEFKRDAQGRYWVIEPTVGRTDFWLGLCIGSGCDLPAIEFAAALGWPCTDDVAAYRPAIWFDSERDVLAPIKHLPRFIPGLGVFRRPMFSFFQWGDSRPFWRSLRKASARITRSLIGRLRVKPEVSITFYNHLDALPPRFISLLKRRGDESIFLGRDWFANFCKTVATRADEVRFYCLEDEAGRAVAMLPMWQQNAKFHGVTVRKLTGLSNYYSPVFDVFYDHQLIEKSQAFSHFIRFLWAARRQWDVVDLFPLCEQTIEAIDSDARRKMRSFSYFKTKNYYQTIDGDFSRYIANRPSRLLNTIRRKTKKLDAGPPWSVEIYTGGEDIEEKLEQYHRVYLSSWKDDEPYPHFIGGLVRMAAANHSLRMGILSIDEQVVAVQLWLVANGVAYIYKLAYDKSYRQYSPGTILTARMTEYVIEVDKVSKIDFLTGQDSFKRDWMESSTNLYGFQIANYSSPAGMFVFVVNNLSQVKHSLSNLLGSGAPSSSGP